ncbi:hypothetical protein KC19_2G063300 [Ceratodon purpureus]|uniref:Uncharacterized protein n=1 Tax=Ceratodon purpureus TaxID=3225 RepID=A0A8T0IQS4_CERPU|nr:hypothetical protein KC19_2G063300 [Ceratodon purpureus]
MSGRICWPCRQDTQRAVTRIFRIPDFAGASHASVEHPLGVSWTVQGFYVPKNISSVGRWIRLTREAHGSSGTRRRSIWGTYALGGCRWIFAGVYLHSQHGNLSTGFGSVHCWHPGRTASIATTNEDCRVSRNLQENR